MEQTRLEVNQLKQLITNLFDFSQVICTIWGLCTDFLVANGSSID